MRGAAAALRSADRAAPTFLGVDQVEGFAAVFGLASFAPGFSATFGVALACLTEVGLASFFGLAVAVATGFLAATRVFLPRCLDVCFSVSAAIAAISAVPVLAGPV